LIAVAVAMTAAFGIPRARIVSLLAAGGLSLAAGVTFWQRPPIEPSIQPSIAAVLSGALSGAAICVGCLLLAAGFACLTLMKQSAASRREGGYSIRTSINLERR
jgi:hypothetical protein